MANSMFARRQAVGEASSSPSRKTGPAQAVRFGATEVLAFSWKAGVNGKNLGPLPGKCTREFQYEMLEQPLGRFECDDYVFFAVERKQRGSSSSGAVWWLPGRFLSVQGENAVVKSSHNNAVLLVRASRIRKGVTKPYGTAPTNQPTNQPKKRQVVNRSYQGKTRAQEAVHRSGKAAVNYLDLALAMQRTSPRK